MANIKIKPMHKNIAMGLGVLALVAILFIPGILPSIGATIFGQPPANCSDTPYAGNCFCSDGDERFDLLAFGVPKFVCEIEAKFIDPTDADWETQATAYGEQKLAEAYSTCNSIACTQGIKTMIWGWKDFERRIIYLECLTSAVPQQRLNHITFFLDDGTVDASSCGDFVEPTSNEPETTLEFVETGPWARSITLKISTECNGIGTVNESYTYTSQETQANDWYFLVPNAPGGEHLNSDIVPADPRFAFYTCNLENEQSNSVTIRCIGECSGSGSISSNVYVRYE